MVTSLASPKAYNLPHSEWRVNQAEAIEAALNSPKQVVFLSAPTGCLSGKTKIGTNRGGNGRSFTLEYIFKKSQTTWRKDVQTFLRSRDDEGYLRLNKMDSVVYSGLKTTFTVETESGKTLRATKDHKFFTENGWKRLSEISVGDSLWVEGDQKQKESKNKPWYKLRNGLNSHPYCGRKGIRPDKGGYSAPLHRLIVEAEINELSLDDYILKIKTNEVSGLMFLDPKKFTVHHKDLNSLNNDISNLQILTPKEHRKIHSEHNWRNVVFSTNLEKIVSIKEFGKEDTYDICMESDPHNFVADGFVVHNSGKSAIAVTLTQLLGKKAAIITGTKSLQQQYINEFKALDLLYLIGRENYRCLIDPVTFNAANAPCSSGWVCKKKFVCDYFERKIRAGKWFSPVITNYPYFLSETNSPAGLLQNLDVMILDEGHLAETALMAYVNVTLDDVELRKVGLKLPKLRGIENYKKWAMDQRMQLSSDLLNLQDYLRENEDPFSEVLFLQRHKKLQQSDMALSKMAWVKDDWIMESQPKKIMFRPLWVKEFGDLYTSATKKLIIQSATIVNPQKMADLLGIKDFDYVEIPSSFPKERRPLYFWPVAKVDNKNESESQEKILKAIDDIIDKHEGERGIIHTVNYKIRDLLLLRSKHSAIMLTHKPKDRDKVIEEFLEGSSKKRILVSPSVTSGLNASYHRCSFQIICKVPFKDRSEKQVKKRMEEDPEWYSFTAACDLVQAYGRAMRYEDDYGVTYVIDEHFGWFYGRNRLMFPKFFREAVKKIDSLEEV